MDIGNRIRSLRLKHHMTQAQLAKELGVQYQTISKWETGITHPDILLLPQLADLFGITMDELFGRRHVGCSGHISQDSTSFLLNTYAQMYDAEAGPWNLSVENKYLEYRIADFFEKHFIVGTDTNICNIGIGAGEWDHYLSYQLKNGTLTSIDKEEICCKQLQQRLQYEGNPKSVEVLWADAMQLSFCDEFDIVTMVGSTVMEGGIGLLLLEKAMDFVKPGGALYYQTLDKNEDCNATLQTAFQHGLTLDTHFPDNSYGFHCHYYKFIKT